MIGIKLNSPWHCIGDNYIDERRRKYEKKIEQKRVVGDNHRWDAKGVEIRK